MQQTAHPSTSAKVPRADLAIEQTAAHCTIKTEPAPDAVSPTSSARSTLSGDNPSSDSDFKPEITDEEQQQQHTRPKAAPCQQPQPVTVSIPPAVSALPSSRYFERVPDGYLHSFDLTMGGKVVLCVPGEQI